MVPCTAGLPWGDGAGHDHPQKASAGAAGRGSVIMSETGAAAGVSEQVFPTPSNLAALVLQNVQISSAGLCLPPPNRPSRCNRCLPAAPSQPADRCHQQCQGLWARKGQLPARGPSGNKHFSPQTFHTHHDPLSRHSKTPSQPGTTLLLNHPLTCSMGGHADV